MAANEYIRLETNIDGCSIGSPQVADYLRRELTPPIMSAIVAIGVDHLAIERLLLYPGVFAGFVTWERMAAPIRMSRGKLSIDNRFIAIAADWRGRRGDGHPCAHQ